MFLNTWCHFLTSGDIYNGDFDLVNGKKYQWFPRYGHVRGGVLERIKIKLGYVRLEFPFMCLSFYDKDMYESDPSLWVKVVYAEQDWLSVDSLRGCYVHKRHWGLSHHPQIGRSFRLCCTWMAVQFI